MIPVFRYYSQKPGFSNVPSQSPFETAPEGSLSATYFGDNRGTTGVRSEYEPVPFSSSMNESSPTGITDSIPQGRVYHNVYTGVSLVKNRMLIKILSSVLTGVNFLIAKRQLLGCNCALYKQNSLNRSDAISLFAQIIARSHWSKIILDKPIHRSCPCRPKD